MEIDRGLPWKQKDEMEDRHGKRKKMNAKLLIPVISVLYIENNFCHRYM